MNQAESQCDQVMGGNEVADKIRDAFSQSSSCSIKVGWMN